MKRFFIRLLNYEYYPMWCFYGPLFPYFLFRALVNFKFFHFVNINKGIDEYGGFFFDSKMSLYNILPSQFLPKTAILNKENLNTIDFEFPYIIKPDNAERGKEVFLITEKTDFNSLHLNYPKYIVQEYIDGELEVGVFVVYFPEFNQFKITSLTQKKYFTVTGNGNETIEELVLKNKRGIVFFNELKANSKYDFKIKLKEGEQIIIHKMGNHCKGTEFINANDKITHEMEAFFNQFMKNHNDIEYGRFDIILNKFNDLETGNFKIIEFNGLAAEPIHLYDSSVGYINSLKVFKQHFEHMQVISRYNKKKGIKAMPDLKVIKKIGQKLF